MAKYVKRYVCIVKVGNNPDGSAKCVRYSLNDLLKFRQFLDRDWPEWRWMNVYSKKTRQKLAQYTKRNPPISSRV